MQTGINFTELNIMKKLLMAAAMGCIWLQTEAADLSWGTDLPKALIEAKAEQKLVLMDFTGSDWCPACILFHDQVAMSPKFAAYAKTNLVLIVVDFPNKVPQSDALKSANMALQKKYEVEGFPTLVLLNADGKELGRQLGYDSSGAEAFIAKVEGYSKK
jgi:thioredoxin-related protein